MLRLLVVLVLCVGAYWPAVSVAADGQEVICDQSWVIFCDNFNVRAAGTSDMRRATFKNTGWDVPNGNVFCTSSGCNSLVRITDPAGVTSTMLEQSCTAYNNGYNVCGSFTSSYFIRSVPEVYFRWYAKWSSNFVWNSGQKHAGLYYNAPQLGGLNIGNQEGSCGTPRFTFYFNLGLAPASGTCGSVPAGTFAYFLQQDLNPPAVVWNQGGSQWYCIETHVKLNNPGSSSNGIAELWINGVQKISRSDLNIVTQLAEITNRNMDQLNFYSRWQCGAGEQADGGCYGVPAGSYIGAASHPVQQRWIDNVVVGTQRVGCLGSTPPPPPADTVPPSPPTNLQVAPQ